MRVGVYYSNNDVRVEEVEKPKIGPGELLVKVMASGICGTDVLEWYRLKNAPRVLGHEISGEVVEVGLGSNEFKEGDRVFASHHVPCNSCRYCLSGHHTACDTLHKTNFYPGGFSEYIRVPEINTKLGVLPLRNSVSFKEATFIEPLGCIIRGQKLSNVTKDSTLLILGSGISGLLHIKLAKEKGVERIIATDISENRLRKAVDVGADIAINPIKDNVKEKLLQFNDNHLADRVILCTGSEAAVEQAFQCVERGGNILFFAVPDPQIKTEVPITEFWRNEITITTSYGASPDDLREALSILEKKEIQVNDLITHILPLDEIQTGFNLVAEAKDSLKVIIEPFL